MQNEQEKELRVQFSNYERTVWVVNSIEGHLQHYYRDLIRYFDRYPAIPLGGKELTPDFTVVFHGPYEIVGEVKRALGRGEAIDERYKQLKGYDTKLKFRLKDGDVYEHESLNHDILLFINIEWARVESKTLSQLLRSDRKNGSFKRSVSVFSATNDTQAARTRWIFNWEPRTDKLRDSKLPAGRRLSERHQKSEEPIVIYPDSFTGIQAVHRFCNDAPPAIYVAVILWSKVFPRVMTTEEREAWTLDSDCQGTIDIQVNLQQLIDETRRFVGYQIKKTLMKRVLEILSKAKLAKKKNEEAFEIHFRKLRVVEADEADEEITEERKLDHVKEALIRAIARGDRPGRISGGRLPRRRRGAADKNQLPLL